MEGRITCGLWLLVVFLSGCGRLAAFNLDTTNVPSKRGEPGSLFGFSLAMHRQLNPTDKTWLLVGAPRAKALSKGKSTVTGGLYSCDMSSASSFCKRIVFDNKEDKTAESKENQWLGVSVSSQGPGGKILTCAHRYQKRSYVDQSTESREINGRCHLLSQDFKPDSTYSLCENRLKGHAHHGSCQQGVAAIFDDEYHYMIFSAPGAFSWKGVVRMTNTNQTLVDERMLAGNYDEDGPYEVGGRDSIDAARVPVFDNSYLGFSLDSGKHLTNKGQLTVVAGAPRYSYTGAVLLMKMAEPDNMVKEFILEGEGLASSFGYDVTVLDLNNDGWQDIVVGAPQFYMKDSEIGGAVYVYINNAGKWKQVTPTRIDGPMDSMFGLAVEKMGDLNMDGFDDFAVGAPYDEEGVGQVYIYHGSAAGLSSDTKASQVLSGKSQSVKLFGYSLAGGMDLDKNGSPDLAVGSLSDAIFLFRSRPVVNIKKEVTFSPKEIDLTKKNCGDKFCLDIEACFTYTASPASYAPKLMVKYTLVADADHKKKGLNPRGSFLKANSYKSEGTVTINSKGTKQCFKEKLSIQEDIRDKLQGIPIDVSLEIVDTKRKRRDSSPELTPALDDKESKMSRSMVNFIKEGCGGDVCRSNLQVKYRYGRRTTDKFNPFEKEGDVSVVYLSDQNDVALEVTVTNPNGDDAHEAALNVTFPSSITYSSADIPAKDRHVNCRGNRDGSQVQCDIGNPFRRDSEVVFYIILGTGALTLDTNTMGIDLQLETTSDQSIQLVTAMAKVAIQLKLSVTGHAFPSQVYFSGKVKGEEAMKTESDIGSAITHEFRIFNQGKSLKNFGNAILEINWPKETKDGKWLLYLTEISSTGLTGMECTPKDAINPNRKELTKTRTRRAVGETQEGQEGTISRYTDKKKFETLSCGKGATCVKITCPLMGFERTATVVLKSRLWNGTFIEDYSKLHHVEVLVNTDLRVDTEVESKVENATTQVRLIAFPEKHALQYAGVPWWVIVLSILFALLLLALLVFLLWKCGFFERAKHEDEVPTHSAVWIKREEIKPKSGNANWENLEKKPWMTTWHDNKEHYS